MEHIIINVFFCISENSDQDFSKDVYHDKTLNKLEGEISILLKKYNIELDSSHTLFLNKQKYAIHHCDRCKHLMIDRTENPVRFDAEIESLFKDVEIIYDGARVGDSFLCSRCLPPTHRWSWD